MINRPKFPPVEKRPATREELITIFGLENVSAHRERLEEFLRNSRESFFESVEEYAAKGALVASVLVDVRVMVSTEMRDGLALLRLRTALHQDFYFYLCISDLKKLGDYLSEEAKRLAKELATDAPILTDDLREAFEANRETLEQLKRDSAAEKARQQ